MLLFVLGLQALSSGFISLLLGSEIRTVQRVGAPVLFYVVSEVPEEVRVTDARFEALLLAVPDECGLDLAFEGVDVPR